MSNNKLNDIKTIVGATIGCYQLQHNCTLVFFELFFVCFYTVIAFHFLYYSMLYNLHFED
jgi:hypothetical protein